MNEIDLLCSLIFFPENNDYYSKNKKKYTQMLKMTIFGIIYIQSFTFSFHFASYYDSESFFDE